MADLVPKVYDDILSDEIAWAVAHTTKITDFNDGSITKAILSAVALVIEEAYFDIMLGWKSALKYALQRSLGFDKLDGAKATGNVTFGRSTNAPSDITIDIGTIVATDDGVRFITTEVGTIPTGQQVSGSVAVEAEVVGTSGNVIANTVTTLVSTPTGVETVNNASALTGGVNEESNSNYDIRFSKYIQGLTRSTLVGLEAGALSVVGVVEAYIYEASAGNLVMYINDGSGIASAGLLSDVASVIEGDGTSANPGYRPAGIFINYQSSVKVDINITAIIYHDNTVTPADIENAVAEAISNHINNLKIGADVVIAGIVDVAMEVAGVKDFTISVPATNVITDKALGEVARYNSGSYSTAIYVDQP